MTQYTPAFDAALNHAMLYEVGGFWNLDTPGVREGLIDTPAQRRAVGYTNDPTDHGGETKFGIAGKANPDLDIRSLDWDAVCRVYYKRYWLPGDCQDLPSRLAALHFDGCIQHSITRAATFIQRAVGVKDDGDIGPATIKAVLALDEIDVCHAVCDARALFYHQIVDKTPDQIKYLNGWLRRVEEMRTFVTDTTRSF